VSKHLHECHLAQPCDPETPEHGVCAFSGTFCIHCARHCICHELRTYGGRLLAEKASKRVPRYGASGRTGLPEQMSNGEWVRYADHVAAFSEGLE
jgi:hypothetical protein